MKTFTSDFADHRLEEAGWEALSQTELLALFLAPGLSAERALEIAQSASRFLRSKGNLKSFSYADWRESGLTHRRTIALLSALQLARVARRYPLGPDRVFHSSLEVFNYFRPLVKGLETECFWSLLLDGKNRVKRLVRVSEGCLTSSIVHPREVFRPAIREAAAGVLFVHNHPSGEPSPSQEDRHVTSRLVETGRVIGIRVLDHVIIGSYRYYSFADEGVLG